MRPLYLMLAGMLLLSLLTGCEKKCTQLNVCHIFLSQNKTPRTIAYYARDVDTQILLCYKPNGMFDQQTDRGCYINTDVTGGYIYNETDTQYLSIGFCGSSSGSQRINDMELVLPGVRTYRFTEIMVDGNYTEGDEFTCSSGSRGSGRRVTSMKIDGIFHDFSNWNTRLELHK
jgi:hypothetical protein